MKIIELDGENYYEVDTLEYLGVEYLLLSKEDDMKDICLRKIVYENDEKRVSTLDDEQEFDTVIDLFIQRNKDIII